MFSLLGPGPGKYMLPPVIGFNSHDVSKYRNPQYSMGITLQDLRKPIGPGPRYDIQNMTPYGRTSPPAYSMKSRPKILSRYILKMVGNTDYKRGRQITFSYGCCQLYQKSAATSTFNMQLLHTRVVWKIRPKMKSILCFEIKRFLFSLHPTLVGISFSIRHWWLICLWNRVVKNTIMTFTPAVDMCRTFEKLSYCTPPAVSPPIDA